MKKSLKSLIGAVLIPAAGLCQNFNYTNIALKTVTFSGGLTIQKDDGSGSYSSPQWNAGATINFPVAYVSGKAPTVSATFSLTCSSVPDYVWIKGTGPESMEFPSTKVAVETNSSHTITYPATASLQLFENAIIRFFKPYTINWHISFDGGTTWIPAGSSSNTMYVTKSNPQTATNNFKWYHTVFDISCRNADKKTVETEVISSVWSEFTDHVVLNCNGDSLFYYKAMNSPNVTLGSLLKYRDAECYTFAQLFLSLLKIQGIVKTNNYIYIEADGSTACGSYRVDRFLVKDWIFGTPSGSCQDFPFENTYTTLIPAPYTAYKFTKADVKDGVGIPGSCTKNPSSFFNNHQIAKIDGVYYDACYGVTFNQVTDIKTQAFSGWSYRYTDNSGMVHAFITKDMSRADLDETVQTF